MKVILLISIAVLSSIQLFGRVESMPLESCGDSSRITRGSTNLGPENNSGNSATAGKGIGSASSDNRETSGVVATGDILTGKAQSGTTGNKSDAKAQADGLAAVAGVLGAAGQGVV